MSATPFTATCPPLVIVQAFPLASVMAAVEPASTTASLGDAVNGSGLVRVAADQDAVGLVLLYQLPKLFSCHTAPVT